jgi:D-alanyl-D-alanine carboxypeptidase
MIAERVAGRPLAALYEQRIIKPLGLVSAAYDPQGEISGPHPHGYDVQTDGVLTDTTGWGTGGTAAAAGIVSDATDEARFLDALMQGALIGPAELHAMETPSVASAPTPYGLGLTIDAGLCGTTAYGHSGAGSSSTTDVLVSGDARRTVVLLLNGRTADSHSDTVAHAAAIQLYCNA